MYQNFTHQYDYMFCVFRFFRRKVGQPLLSAIQKATYVHILLFIPST